MSQEEEMRSWARWREVRKGSGRGFSWPEEVLSTDQLDGNGPYSSRPLHLWKWDNVKWKALSSSLG